MMCYRDMTYCPFWLECADGDICERALTDEVKQAARFWFPDHPDIAYFIDRPSCFEPLES